MKAADVMTTHVITVTPELIGDAAKLMLQYCISGLPILNHEGELVGMLPKETF
jgi:CBS domain-containing protein